jgi:hypothetical protein
MNEQLFTILVQVAGIILAVIGGFGAVPIVNWLKGLLKLSGNSAIILTVAFAAVWGIAELFVGGQLDQSALTMGNLAAVVTAVFAISQAKYKMLQGQR